MRGADTGMNRRTGRTALVPYGFSAVVCLLTLVLLFSCKPPLGGKQEPASLTVSFSASSFSRAGDPSRTVVPAADLEITSITVTVTHDGGPTTESVASASETCTIGGIAPGVVTITAVAHNATGEVARGTDNVPVIEGQSHAVTIALVPKVTLVTGTGKFAFSMRWPESTGATYVSCSLQTPAGAEVHAGNPPLALTASGGFYTWTYSDGGEDVLSGTYNLFITFRASAGGTLLGAFVESVNIYDNLTSDTWLDGEGNHLASRTFIADELKDSLTDLFRLTVTGSGFSHLFTAASTPSLEDGVTYPLSRTSSPGISFTPVLLAPGTGQDIDYVLIDESTGTTIATGTADSGITSGQLTLADGAAGNSLAITVTSSNGDSAAYTVTVLKAYRLSYEGNGATDGAVPEGGLYCLNETVPVAGSGSLVREGWSFSGWNTEPDGSGTSYDPDDPEHDSFSMAAEPLTLYARWIENGTVEVSFSLPEYHSLEFQFTSPGTVLQGQTLSFTTSLTGATGWSWYVDGALQAGEITSTFDWNTTGLHPGQYVIGAAAMYNGHACTGSTTVKVEYDSEFTWVTVIYDANGGSGDVPVNTNRYVSGQTVTVAENTGGLTKTGTGFSAWNTAPDGTGDTYEPGSALIMPSTNVTLYAKWKTWVTVGSPGFSAGMTKFNSLSINPSGIPFVAFSDGNYKSTVMKYNGISWIPVGLAGFSAGTASYNSLALDSSNTPYVAFRDGAMVMGATVMKFDDILDSWVTVGPAGFSEDQALNVSLALDSFDTPYVVYGDRAYSYAATVMRFDDILDSWVTVGTAGFSVGGTEYNSLVFSSSDTPYVAYQDGGNGSRATVMKFDGLSWEPVGLPGFSVGMVTYVSLALDSSDTPYVAFRNYYTRADVMKFDNILDSWVMVGPAGFSADTVDYVSLALDSSDTPYVAFQDAANGNRATVMRFESSSWVPVGSVGFSAGAATYISLAFDSSDTPYIGYCDGVNDSKATVMCFK